jgi:hypothetical protein
MVELSGMARAPRESAPASCGIAKPPAIAHASPPPSGAPARMAPQLGRYNRPAARQWAAGRHYGSGRMVAAFTVLLGIQLLGEFFPGRLQLPISGAVIGLLLRGGCGAAAELNRAVKPLLRKLGPLFIATTVGVVIYLPLLRSTGRGSCCPS